MDLHVKLHVSQLPEPHPAYLALVGLLPRVDPHVSEQVGVDPEGLVALLTLMRFLSGVLQLVGLEGLRDDEPLPAHVTTERTFSCMDPLMVVVRGFVEKGLSACGACVLPLPGVNLLVSPQGAGRVQALAAGLAAEGRHVHRGSVPSVDHSAVPFLSSAPPDDLPVPFIVSGFLVFLQLAVVQKGLPTEVTHEGL